MCPQLHTRRFPKDPKLYEKKLLGSQDKLRNLAHGHIQGHLQASLCPLLLVPKITSSRWIRERWKGDIWKEREGGREEEFYVLNTWFSNTLLLILAFFILTTFKEDKRVFLKSHLKEAGLGDMSKWHSY